MRIEEKYRDFRKAFRSFDKNYDGDLSFKEFMQGLENIGIKLKYKDYRLIFEAIDYDKAEEIDFNKFCLLNTDKSKRLRMDDIIARTKSLAQKGLLNSGKPPSGKSQPLHPGFADGVIPKNKSMESFTKDVTEESERMKILNKRKK